MGAAASILEGQEAVREARATAGTVLLFEAQWARAEGQAAIANLQRSASAVEQLLPDRSEAATLGFGYSSTQALTELNGAMVRVLDVLDSIESVPDSVVTDTVNEINPIPTEAEAKLRAAMIATYDLELKILDYEAQVPSEWDRLSAKIHDAGAGIGDALSTGLEAFLSKAVANLWFWLAVVGVVLFFVYFKGPARAVAGAVAA